VDGHTYLRDGIEMVEVAPHQYVNRPAAEALGLVQRAAAAVTPNK
jgi:hypothetical protein